MTLQAAARLRVFAPGVRRALVMATLPQLGAWRMFADFRRMNGPSMRAFHDLRAGPTRLPSLSSDELRPRDDQP